MVMPPGVATGGMPRSDEHNVPRPYNAETRLRLGSGHARTPVRVAAPPPGRLPHRPVDGQAHQPPGNARQPGHRCRPADVRPDPQTHQLNVRARRLADPESRLIRCAAREWAICARLHDLRCCSPCAPESAIGAYCRVVIFPAAITRSRGDCAGIVHASWRATRGSPRRYHPRAGNGQPGRRLGAHDHGAPRSGPCSAVGTSGHSDGPQLHSVDRRAVVGAGGPVRPGAGVPDGAGAWTGVSAIRGRVQVGYGFISGKRRSRPLYEREEAPGPCASS
jgi:hypothetical protein